MKRAPGREAAVVSPQRSPAAGSSLLKLAAVAIIFSALVALLLPGITFYQGKAEHAGMQLQLVNMRSALSSMALQAALRSRPEEMAALAGANPIAWLERLPTNYRGEIHDGANKILTPGNWYFDLASRTLVYVSTSKKSFPADAFERQYFKVESVGLPINNAKPHGTPSQSVGVALIQVDGK